MNKPFMTITTKSGKQVEFVLPSMDLLKELIYFINRLAKEDTYLSFDPDHEFTIDEEKTWLENVLVKMKFSKAYLVWVIYDGKIIGSCDFNKGSSVRTAHVATIGLMVDQDWRGDGIGGKLFDYVLEKAKTDGYKLATLTCFADNEAGLGLYKKFGFEIGGTIPEELYRKGKYTDCLYMYKKLIN